MRSRLARQACRLNRMLANSPGIARFLPVLERVLGQPAVQQPGVDAHEAAVADDREASDVRPAAHLVDGHLAQRGGLAQRQQQRWPDVDGALVGGLVVQVGTERLHAAASGTPKSGNSSRGSCWLVATDGWVISQCAQPVAMSTAAWSCIERRSAFAMCRSDSNSTARKRTYRLRS